jgi:hypothetical protein
MNFEGVGKRGLGGWRWGGSEVGVRGKVRLEMGKRRRLRLGWGGK